MTVNLTEKVATAIAQAESELTDRQLKEHKLLRKSLADVLKWLQARKVGFLAPKPRIISEGFLPSELREYLNSEYCQDVAEILIPYEWEVDCDRWKETGENRNFWHITKISLAKKMPMPTINKSTGLGSANTWERGRD